MVNIEKGMHLIMFSGETCPACKKLEPVLKILMTKNKTVFEDNKIEFNKIMVEEDPNNLAKRFSIRSLPVTILIKNGEELIRYIGASPRVSDLETALLKDL